VAVTLVQGEDAAEDAVREIRALGRRAVALRADLADAAEAAGAAERAADPLGGLDVLVDNGDVGLLGPVQDISPADVEWVLAVHARGVFLTSRAAAARMDRGTGSSPQAAAWRCACRAPAPPRTR